MKKISERCDTHVVRMIGCVVTSEPFNLITEFMTYGNLLEYMRSIRNMVSHSTPLPLPSLSPSLLSPLLPLPPLSPLSLPSIPPVLSLSPLPPLPQWSVPIVKIISFYSYIATVSSILESGVATDKSMLIYKTVARSPHD